MPDKSSHKKPEVSAELIRQYLAGELDDKAMHALERQALDDPFLAEALEGFDQHAPEQQAHLDDLQARLTARVAASRQKKVIPMYYRWVAAAAILLLVTSGAWWIWNQQLPKERPIVKMETQHADSAAAATLSATLSATPSANTIDSSHAALDQVADTAPAKEAETTTAPQDKAPAPAIAAAPVAKETIPAADPVKPVLARRKATAKGVTPSAQIASAEAIAANNAALSAPAASAAKQLPAPDNTIMYAKPAPPLSQLHIIKGEEKAAGIQKKEISTTLTDTPKVAGEVTTVLQGQVNGVAVTSEKSSEQITLRGVASPSATSGRVAGQDTGNNSEAPAYRRPEPASGWKEYQQYLKNNTVYPDTVDKKKPSGNVRVSFKVMPDGSLQDFKVIKSMGAAFDAEAIRVIKAGPSWTPASDHQPALIKVKVFFAPGK